MSPDHTDIASQLVRLYPQHQRSTIQTSVLGDSPDLPDLTTYKSDPVGFCRDVLGVSLTPDQQAIIRGLPGRVKVNAGHGLGKTHVAAVATVWWFYTRPHSVVVTTAPKQQHVETVLWGEIRTLISRAIRPLTNYLQPKAPKLWDHPEHWAEGMTSAKGEAFQGRHRESMLFIFDEAEGLPPLYWHTTDTMYQPGQDHGWLAIGNPITTSSQSAVEDRATLADGSPKWKMFTLSALNHPNIHAELRGEKAPIPNAVSLAQVNQWFGEWADRVSFQDRRPGDVEWPPESGTWYRPSPSMKGRVLGIRPSEGVDTVFGQHAWEEAVRPRYTDEYVWLHRFGITLGCFVAGTLIKTETGDVPIENVKVGDKVLTRCGYKSVSNSFCTGVKQTWTLTSEDGRTLSGTGDHPIWDGSGWRRLDSLMSEDMVTIWKPPSTTASSFAAIRHPDGTGIVATFLHGTPENKYLFTGTSGRRRGAKFRMAGLFTTEMKIQPTTILTTWNASLLHSIPNFMMLFLASGPWLVCGTRVQRVKPGTEQWPEPEVPGNQKQDRVTNVALTTSTRQVRQSSVLADASAYSGAKAGLTTNSVSAVNVEMLSHAASTSLPQLAPVRVRTNEPGKPAEVYNLTVDDCPEYFANGILVHNCDVATYGDDNTVIHVRSGPLSLHHESHNGWGPQRIAARVKELCVEWSAWYNARSPFGLDRPALLPSQVQVIVELDGPGFAVLDNCMENGQMFGHWSGIKVAEASEEVDQQGTPKYFNKRSEIWHSGAAKASAGEMDLSRLPRDVLARLRDQLLTPAYELLPSGTVKVESKDAIKERLRRSPDDADALLVCYTDASGWLPTALFKQEERR